MQNKTVLITGITGQTGSYLAERFLSEGYTVIGTLRRVSVDTTQRIRHILNKITLVEADILDFSSIISILQTHQPSYVINCAAQSHVKTSFNQPLLTWDITAKGAMNVIEACRLIIPKTRIVQLSSSEMMGATVDDDGFQRETTNFKPQSPYAVAKLAVHNMVRIYRESYDMFICSCICFNKESERRGDNFVTRKITKYVAGLQDFLKTTHITETNYPKLQLGNLAAQRDWMHVEDAVDGIFKIITHYEPDDFVIGSGITRSVEDFVREAFRQIYIFNWRSYVEINADFFRPLELNYLKCDASKIKRVLNWKPKISFSELVNRMVKYDIKEYMPCYQKL